MKEDLGKAIYAVNISGVDSPLDLAIDAATMDLKLLAGKSAVIIFSDGVDMPKAVASAQAMKAAMKENICIYTVQIGNDPAGKELLQKVVKAGDCGAYVTGEEVSSAAGMAAFVEKVFIRHSFSTSTSSCQGSACSGSAGRCPSARGSQETGGHLFRF